MITKLKKLLKAEKLNTHQLKEDQFIELKLTVIDCNKYLKFLKEHQELKFTILSDLFAVDFPARPVRFEVVYNIFSLKLNQRIIVKLQLQDKEKLQSIAKIYSAATWYEREIDDMFGIECNDNKDKRRLLTDDAFVGHPLRKDFPLTGYVQVKYDKVLEKVIYEPVKLDQEYRNFDFVSPWDKNPILDSEENKKNK